MDRSAPSVLYARVLIALCLTVGLAVGCAPSQEEAAQPEDLAETDSSAGSTFHPVPMPDPGIPGYTFPTPEATILGWVGDNDIEQMALHSWGIWTALTTETDQIYNGTPLRVFETWLTPNEIRDLQASGVSLEEAGDRPRDPRPLGELHQFLIAKRQSAAVDVPDATGFVKYDPTAAQHAEREQLFSVAALDEMLSAGETGVPGFPSTAVAVKPVFQKLQPLAEDRYYLLAAWPGSPYLIEGYQPSPNCWPDEKDGVTAGFGTNCWQQCVWIDTQGTGSSPATPGVDTTCSKDGSSRTADSTYPLSAFIHFPAEDGTHQALLGMHVTTRESTRWTWQSFWWSYDPANPKPPSSKAIAAARPAQLTGAPANYAHCIGYSMLQPPQPNTGGSNTGESVYCYNPWLEAGFDSSVVPNSKPGTFQGNRVANNVGVQTGCMSCHAFASFDKGNATNLAETLYTGDRYVDLEDAQFDGNLQTDFLWSIPYTAK